MKNLKDLLNNYKIPQLSTFTNQIEEENLRYENMSILSAQTTNTAKNIGSNNNSNNFNIPVKPSGYHNSLNAFPKKNPSINQLEFDYVEEQSNKLNQSKTKNIPIPLINFKKGMFSKFEDIPKRHISQSNKVEYSPIEKRNHFVSLSSSSSKFFDVSVLNPKGVNNAILNKSPVRSVLSSGSISQNINLGAKYSNMPKFKRRFLVEFYKVEAKIKTINNIPLGLGKKMTKSSNDLTLKNQLNHNNNLNSQNFQVSQLSNDNTQISITFENNVEKSKKITANDFYNAFFFEENEENKAPNQISNSENNQTNFEINNNFYGNISINSILGNFLIKGQKQQLDEQLKQLNELSINSLNHLTFLSKPRIFQLQVEEENLESKSNTEENENEEEEEHMTSEENFANIKIKLQRASLINTKNRNELEVHVGLKKQIVFKDILIRLQPSVLGFSYNLDHYILAYSFVESINSQSLTNNRRKSDNIQDDVSSTSTKNVKRNKEIKEYQEVNYIDLYKIRSVSYINSDLIINIDGKDTQKLLIKIDSPLGEEFSNSLKYMINLVKIKALLFKVKQSSIFS